MLTVLLALAAQSPTQKSEQDEVAIPHVAFELVADRTRVAAGDRFRLGARFVVPPGLHIGWQNPGEGGFATEVKLEAPEGFVVEGPIWPGPDRFDLPGENVEFGYAGDVSLVFSVTAPKELAPRSRSTFRAISRWRASGEKSAIDGGDKRLVLETVDAAHPSRAANEKLFELAEERAPKSWKELRDATVEWKHDLKTGANGVLVRVEHCDRLEFCPSLDGGGLDFKGRAFDIQRDATTILLAFVDSKEKLLAHRALRGVLRVQRGKERAWYAVDLERPEPPAEH